MMELLLESINTAEYDSVVSLGVSNDLIEALCETSNKLYLIDADPEILNEVITKHGSAFIIKANNVIFDNSINVCFKRYNLPEYNSVAEPEFLLDIYPSLETVDETSVEATCPLCLLETFEIDENKKNLLIIDLPGIQYQVTNLILNSEKRFLFRDIVCFSPLRPLYKNEAPLSKMKELFTNKYYNLENVTNEKNDYSILFLKLNTLAKKVFLLEVENEKLLGKCDQQVKHNNELSSKIHSQEKKTVKIEGQLASNEKALQEAVKKRHELESQLELQSVKLLEAEKSLKHIFSERDELLNKCEQQIKHNNELSSKIYSQERKTEKIERQLASNEKALQEGVKKRHELESQLELQSVKLLKAEKCLGRKANESETLKTELKELERQMATLTQDSEALLLRFNEVKISNSNLIKDNRRLVNKQNKLEAGLCQMESEAELIKQLLVDSE